MHRRREARDTHPRLDGADVRCEHLVADTLPVEAIGDDRGVQVAETFDERQVAGHVGVPPFVVSEMLVP